MISFVNRITYASGLKFNKRNLSALEVGVTRVKRQAVKPAQADQSCSGQGTFSNGASAGPEKTSPVDLKRDP